SAPSHAYDTHGLLDEADACVLALLNNGPTTPEEVRTAVLGPLLLENNAHLLHTVRAYFRAGTPTAAAESLHVHAQTLRYRLRRVREITGRDPHVPWQRFVLEIACAIASCPRFGPTALNTDKNLALCWRVVVFPTTVSRQH